MDSALPAMSALEAVNRCIDLYMQYIFPTAPFVHEPTLRGAAAHLFSRTGSSEFFRCRPSCHEEVAEMRSFALVTAVCASIASVVPDTLLPSRTSIAGPCLSASRNMMKVFEEFDVEYPSSDSIATRLLHTTALQHTTGKACLSNYTLGQAAYLAQNMRLYSEEALKRHNPLEAQLLRNLFWHMYAADKAATCLGSRPISLHELLFNETMTVCPDTTVSISLFDTARPCYDRTFESRLLVGFYFAPRLWSKAASLIFGIKAYRRGDQASTKAQLTQAYLEFIAILDDLPYWLQVSKIIVSTNDSEDVQFQKTAFWVQRCTILVVYQCLRLVILQQSIENEVEDIMGLRGQDLTTSMIKIDMIRDFIQTLDDIPFVYLQVKGEPTIERIRWVGSVILELLDSRTDKMIMSDDSMDYVPLKERTDDVLRSNLFRIQGTRGTSKLYQDMMWLRTQKFLFKALLPYGMACILTEGDPAFGSASYMSR
ncbi:hypothetical protein TCE0_018f05836 [Talaromyces pinophilus]|uniref:Transcription factor domain-containing protein n=1 Tax=Talaromyces pinophilus TaxID=128442 RepID=A0A510NWJ7_TALPI|nr:hypothetical protein TCE0_018f05836 [Talaromyces pinophilus]